MYKKLRNLFIFIGILLVYVSLVNASSVSDTILEGNTKTYTLDGKSYEITLNFVDSDSAKFIINGEATDDLMEGKTDTLADRAIINVTDILYQDYAGGIHQASFTLTTHPIIINNIRDYGVDADGDGFYDFLIIEILANVSIGGEYEISARLQDNLSVNPHIIDDDEVDLVTGENTILLNFSGIRIFSNRVNGPYELDFLDFEGDSIGTESVKEEFNDLYNTTDYFFKEFQKPGATFTEVFSDFGFDEDGNGLYNYLAIEAEINVTKAGNYRFEGELEFDDEPYIEIEPRIKVFLDIGVSTIQLNFSGIGLYLSGLNGPYRPIELKIRNADNFEELDTYNYISSNYNYTDFEKVGLQIFENLTDFVVDEDNDRFYDYLVIRIPINVTKPGIYTIEEADLDDVGDLYFETYLNTTDEFIDLKFPGFLVYNNQQTRSYEFDELEIEFQGIEIYQLENSYTTNTYNYNEFQRPPIVFSGFYSDYGIDDNDDGLYEYLAAVIGLNVTKAGNYIFNFELSNGSWRPVAETEEKFSLLPGIQNITIPINGSDIFNSKVNGPYKYGDIGIYDLSDIERTIRIDSVEDVYNTSAYNYTDFEHEIKDTTSPNINITSPINNSIITVDSTWLNVTTNENATCQYATSGSVTFPGGGGGGGSIPMNISETGRTKHSQLVENLHDDWSYRLSVSCADNSGNSNSKSVSFDIDSKPIANTFDGATIDFSTLNESELANISNVVLEKTSFGKIDFGSSVLDLRGALDLDNYVKISDNFIGIDTNNLPALNKPATLTMKSLNYDKTPVIYYNEGLSVSGNNVCPSDLCSNINYDASTKTLTFDAAHFTAFWTGKNTTNKLKISDLDVKVDDKSDKNVANNSKISKDAEPESDVEFRIKIENLYTKEENVEIKDIEVEVTIEDIGDDSDLDEEADDFDLEAGEDKTIKINFNIPKEVDEKAYDVIINVNGKDKNGKDHNVVWKLELDVDKERHDVIIDKFNLNPTTISCNRNVNLNAELINIGSEDENEVVLKISNNDLGIQIDKKDIKLEEGTEDNKYEKSFTLKISDDVPSGTYPILINSYYDDSKLSDSKTIDLMIQDCERVKEIKEEVKVEKPITKTEKITPAKKQAPVPVTKISFTETLEYITLLIILNVILIGLIIFMIGYILIRKKLK